MGQPIGERQRWAWLAAGASAVTATSLCGVGWLWVLLGTAIAAGLWLLLDRTLRPCGLAPLLPAAFGGFGRVLAVLTAAFGVAALAWAANLAVRAFPLEDGGPVLGWTLLALAAWGSWKGGAACARCAGVLCLFLLILYGMVAGFAVPEVTWLYLRPAGPGETVWLVLGLFLLPSGIFAVPCRRRRRGGPWPWVLLLPLGAAALAAVTAGVLSPELAAIPATPLYLAAQSVSLFGVMERIEPLLSVAMTMGIFCLMASLACAVGALGNQIRPGRWTGPLGCLLAAALMGPVRLVPLWMVAAGALLFWGLVPLVTLAVLNKRR